MMRRLHPQRGMFLIEALIAILIFSLGILGMIAMAGASVTSQSDAQYRTEANGLVDSIVGEINVGVMRTGPPTSAAANLATSLLTYAHRPTGAFGSCNYTGPETANARVLALLRRAANEASGVPGLPAAGRLHQQIQVSTVDRNRVTISLCWQPPGESAMRRHTFVTYVN